MLLVATPTTGLRAAAPAPAPDADPVTAPSPPGDPVPPTPAPETPAPEAPTPQPEPEPPTSIANPFAVAAEHIVGGANLLVPGSHYEPAAFELDAAATAMAVGLELLTSTGAPADLLQLVRASLTSTQVAAGGVQVHASIGAAVDPRGSALHTAYAPAALAAAQAGAAWLQQARAPAPQPDPAPAPAADPATE